MSRSGSSSGPGSGGGRSRPEHPIFSVNVDISGLQGLANLKEELEKAGQDAVRDLSAMAMAKAVEIASQKLHSRREMYLNALHLEEDNGAWVLSLDQKARWIEEGLEAGFDMLDGLLKSPKARRAKDGSTFVIVPFEHGPGKGATNTPSSTLDIVQAVKKELKNRKIPLGGIERDDAGRPKLGLLHRFSVQAPLKTAHGPGQGWGPLGDVKQGYSDRNARAREHGGPGGGGTPFLASIGVYQHADPAAKSGVKRSVMTFRIASSKHREQGRWQLGQAIEPVDVFKEVHDWCERQVEEMLPQILDQVVAKL